MSTLSRRQWLRGAGGALLPIPFLSSLLPRGARAAPASPRRFVFVGSPWGRDIRRGTLKVNGRAISPWYPEVEPKEIKDGVGVTPLRDIKGFDGFVSPVFGKPFDDLRGKYTIVRGLDGMQISGDGHGTAMALTGSGNSAGGVIGFGYSIDAVMEESRKIYPVTPLARAIRTSVATTNLSPLQFSYSSRSGKAQSLTADRSPSDVYDRLFRPETLAKRKEFSGRHLPVLDAVLDDYRELLRPGRLSAADRYKLDAHVSLVGDIERTLGAAVPRCAGTDPGNLDSAERLHEATMDLEVAALSCGLTNIVTHAIWHHTSELGVNLGEAHSSAHGGTSRPEESGRAAIPQWHVNRWVMERVATFIKKLDATPDGDGTLLDHTVLMYGNWEARGYHSFYDMPVVVAGSPDALSMGQYLDFRPRPILVHNGSQDLEGGRPYNGILVTVLRAMGLQPEDYQRFGQKGFGVYDGYDQKLAAHYRPLLQDRNATLPVLYRG